MIHNIPECLYHYLIEQYIENLTNTILDGYSKKRPVTLRANTLKTNIEDIKSTFDHLHFAYREVNWYKDALIMEHISEEQMKHLEIYQNGEIYLQSLSSMIPPLVLSPKEDENILDMAASPGGKTTQIAEKLMTGEGKVWALDIHKHKVKLIEENANKLGLISKVSAKQLDARKAITEFDSEKFDKILVDAPCSGLGLMRRKPEVKYEKKLADSYSLHDIQVNILEKIAPLLKKGGYLTYSTCTILNIENQKVIDDFLKKHPEFVQEKTYTKNKLKDERDTLSLTIYPDDYMSDGFFIATLRKK